MNVLQVTNTLHKGGAEAHLLSLATGLRQCGVHCEVAFLRTVVDGGSDNLRDAFEQAGITTHYLECENSFDPRSVTRLNRLLASRPWDVLHSHLPRADAAAAGCKVLDREQKWVVTLHHPYDNAYSGARLVPFLSPMWRFADGVIAVSESVRQWAIRRLGVQPSRTRTIVHGISLSDRPALPLRHDRCAIGAIGRYEERKGHETLIRAMVPIRQRFPSASLHIAGHDPWGYGAVLQALIRQLGLEGAVHLTGYVSDKERFFSDIDVFAFASTAEGFGIVLLEAMEAGRPAVVSDISPLNEIICPGVSGMVGAVGSPESFAQAIVALLENGALRAEIGRAARQRVASDFSQATMVSRTFDYYHQVVGRRAEAAAAHRS
jgi:glycosyltransferase involved in cell wall biosynthesis